VRDRVKQWTSVLRVLSVVFPLSAVGFMVAGRDSAWHVFELGPLRLTRFAITMFLLIVGVITSAAVGILGSLSRRRA
jgi:hypothetical protein